MFPCAWIALRNKTGAIYEKMLQHFIGSCNFQLKPEIINGDFERPIIDTFYKTCPGVKFRGCLFHFAQALNRNIQRLGLQTQYCTNIYYRMWLHLFTALPFLPPSAVRLGLNYILFLSNTKSFSFLKVGDTALTETEQLIVENIQGDAKIAEFLIKTELKNSLVVDKTLTIEAFLKKASRFYSFQLDDKSK